MDFSQPGVRGIRASTRQRQFRSQLADILAHFGHHVKSDFFKNLCFIRAGSVAWLMPVKIVGIISARFAFSPLANDDLLR
jgi:hypothetical protein